MSQLTATPGQHAYRHSTDLMPVLCATFEELAAANPDIAQAIETSAEKMPYTDLDQDTANQLDILGIQFAIRDACAKETTTDQQVLVPSSLAVTEALTGQSLATYRPQTNFLESYAKLSSLPPRLRYALSIAKNIPALAMFVAILFPIMKAGVGEFLEKDLSPTAINTIFIITAILLIAPLLFYRYNLKLKFHDFVPHQMSRWQEFSRDKKAAVDVYQNVDIEEKIYLLYELMSEIAEIDQQRAALVQRTPRVFEPVIEQIKANVVTARDRSQEQKRRSCLYIANHLIPELKKRIHKIPDPSLQQKIRDFIIRFDNFFRSGKYHAREFYPAMEKALDELASELKHYQATGPLKEIEDQIGELKRKRFILMACMENLLKGKIASFNYQTPDGRLLEFVYTSKQPKRVKKDRVRAEVADGDAGTQDVSTTVAREVEGTVEAAAEEEAGDATGQPAAAKVPKS